MVGLIGICVCVNEILIKLFSEIGQHADNASGHEYHKDDQR
jgi:hypothetical protein